MNRVSIKYPARVLWAISLVALFAVGPSHPVIAQDNSPRGKVLIIRGLFTVFSLGLDSLGEKLREEGLEVQVVSAFRASAAANQIRQQVVSDPDSGPVVIIGHSRGGDLAPIEARKFGASDVPVDLIVIVDTVRDAVVPRNVKRCVNLYTTNVLGIYSGEQVRAESKETTLLNLHVKDLKDAGNTGFINHFNIQ